MTTFATHPDQYIKGEKLSHRNVRRDAIKLVDRLKGDVSEDEQKNLADAIQELTDDYVKQIDALVKSKQDELTTV